MPGPVSQNLPAAELSEAERAQLTLRRTAVKKRRGRCPSCGKTKAMRLNRLMHKHQSNGRPCPGGYGS